jgi:hypothetical protein
MRRALGAVGGGSDAARWGRTAVIELSQRPSSSQIRVGSSIAAYLSVLLKVLFVGGVLKVFLPLLSDNDFVVITAPLSSPETLGSKRGKPPQPGKQC